MMIEGAWLPISAELAGQRYPDKSLKAMKLILTRGRYTAKVGEQADEGTLKLGSANELTRTALFLVTYRRERP